LTPPVISSTRLPSKRGLNGASCCQTRASSSAIRASVRSISPASAPRSTSSFAMLRSDSEVSETP